MNYFLSWNFSCFSLRSTTQLPPQLGIIECRCLFNDVFEANVYFFSIFSVYLFARRSCHKSKRRQLIRPLGRNSYTLFLSYTPTPRVLRSLANNVSDQIVSVTYLIYVNCTLLLTIICKFCSVPRIGCNQKSKRNCKTE